MAADSTKQVREVWFGEQVDEFSGIRVKYKQYAAILEDVLADATRQMGVSAIVQARAKQIPSFAMKILRKYDKYKQNRAVEVMTDLCGARIITQTKTDVDRVCDFIEENFEIDFANSVDQSEMLKPSEFGYRSVHYIVQFKKGSRLAAKVPDGLWPSADHPFKAEIQVRTIAQHAWADIGHDRIYKSSFKIPSSIQRESARVAALLESADNHFEHLIDSIDEYRIKYVAYLSSDQMRDEIELQTMVRERLPAETQYDFQRMDVACKISRLHIYLAQWQQCIEMADGALSEGADGLPETGSPKRGPIAALLHCRGYAQVQANEPGTAGFIAGQNDLKQAMQAQSNNLEATLHLADSYARQPNDTVAIKRALDYYRAAFDIDPTDPKTLGAYLEHKILNDRNLSIVEMLRPALRAALEKCRNQAQVGVNLPEAHFRAGQFLLLLGRPYECFPEYSQAVAKTRSERPDALNDAIGTVELLARAADASPEMKEYKDYFQWARRFLLLAKAARFGYDSVDEQLDILKTVKAEEFKPIEEPVVIVAGGCAQEYEPEMQAYRPLLEYAFNNHKGTVISGGTRQGIPGIIGEFSAKFPEMHTICFLPPSLPTDGTATRDERYNEIRLLKAIHIENDKVLFSPNEPLQYWIDIICSGIDPSRVRLLGINGGTITAFEYCLATTLGAEVGVIRGSGREAGKLIRKAEVEKSDGVAVLPPDELTVRMFVEQSIPPFLSDDQYCCMAKEIHGKYQADNYERFARGEPSMNCWNELDQKYVESNMQQARHIGSKLKAIHLQPVPIQDKKKPKLYELSSDEVETLAKLEHARWNVGRLLMGWTEGPRDDEKKQRPTLVGWDRLTEEEKDQDREAVGNIPHLLLAIGFEIEPA